MRKCEPTVVLLLSSLLMACSGNGSYGIPVQLGWSSDQVRKVLGAPNETLNQPERKEETTEWYYSSGLVATFNRDHLSFITFPKDTDYKGFLAYTGTTINGVRLTDSKATILSKLGNPTKVENEELPTGTNPDVPEVWPREGRYYWRLKDYTVVATFLNQAQNISSEKKIVWPKDTLTQLTVQK